MKFSRRDFLKAAAGAAGLTATALSPFVRGEILEPLVQPPESALPGEATWYASTCRQCPAGCGIIVRTINGRAKKIEGNPLHPLNQGKICARGQAGLQVLYNPDRLQNAVQQSGGRGSRQFEPLYWDDALNLLAEKLASLGSPDRLVFLGGLMPDHVYRLANRLLNALGASPPISFDLHSAFEGRHAAQELSRIFFGTSELPVYDLAGTEVVYSFGANLLETWMSPVAQSHAYGRLRQGRFGGRGLFMQFEPRLSSTAACADEWIPLQPGSEGFVALAIGRIIVEENMGHVGSQRPNAVLYQNVDVSEMSAVSGVPIETLRRLASIFAEANHAVAIPGGYLSGQQNGLSSMLAVQALNLVIAQIGRTGGVFLSQPGPTDALRQGAAADSFDRVLDLVDRMNAGAVDVLLIHNANPLFELPAAVGFAEAVAKVPFVVTFSSFVDETAVAADLILPDHTYLESWGYQVPMPGADRPLVSGQQPVVRPLYDTRSTADVLLALASRLGGEAAAALPWTGEAAFVQETVAELHGSSLSAYDAETLAGFGRSGVNKEVGGRKEKFRENQPAEVVRRPLPITAPEYSGGSDTIPSICILSLADAQRRSWRTSLGCRRRPIQ
jgi:anaerobic selenocysteine-containing dehydrogenase